MKKHFVAEKTREDRLRRHLGGFTRWDWPDAMRGEPVGAKLHATGLEPRHPRQDALLATLRSHPRSLPPRRDPRSAPRPVPSEWVSRENVGLGK